MHQGVADALTDVMLGHTVLLADSKARVVVRRVVLGNGGGHTVVIDDTDLIGIRQLFRAHFVQGIQHIGGVNVMDHEKVRMGNENISGLAVLYAGICHQQLFRHGVVAPAPLLQRQLGCLRGLGTGGQTQLGVFNQAAVGDDLEQIVRTAANGEGMPVYADALANLHGDDIAAFADILNAVAGDQQNAGVEGIAEENAGKAFCDDAAYTVAREHRCCLLPGGAAAKVRACHQNVARAHGGAELGLQQFKGVLLHFFDGGNGTRLPGIMVSVSMSLPNFQIRPLNTFSIVASLLR